MTKIVLKTNCRYSNPPGLAENLPFLENISSHPFSLNILLVFFNRYFLARFFAVFSCFSVSSFSAILPFWYPKHKTAVVLGAEMHWIASTLCKVCIHSWHARMVLDIFVDIMFGQ